MQTWQEFILSGTAPWKNSPGGGSVLVKMVIGLVLCWVMDTNNNYNNNNLSICVVQCV